MKNGYSFQLFEFTLHSFTCNQFFLQRYETNWENVRIVMDAPYSSDQSIILFDRDDETIDHAARMTVARITVILNPPWAKGLSIKLRNPSGGVENRQFTGYATRMYNAVAYKLLIVWLFGGRG